MTDERFIQLAIAKARESVVQGGFPAGAVVGMKGRVVGEGISIGNVLNDPSSHAEMVSIRNRPSMHLCSGKHGHFAIRSFL